MPGDVTQTFTVAGDGTDGLYILNLEEGYADWKFSAGGSRSKTGKNYAGKPEVPD